MAESNKQVRTSDPYDRFDEAINDPELYPAYQYDERREARQLEPLPQDRVPLFLSDYDQQQYEDERYDDEGPEYTFGSKHQKPRTSYVVTGVLAATTIAAIVGLFSIDATRSVIVNAKASLASLAPSSLGGPSEAAPPAQPPLRVVSAVAPEPRIAAPEAQAVYRSRPTEPAAAPEPAPAPVAAAPAPTKPKEAYAWQPSRSEISAAYQSAAKSQQPQQMAAVAPTAPVPQQPAAPGTRRVDTDEVAGILKRAKTLLAMGDIFAARLLLERAADVEGEAALMLGTTYDPAVVGNQDMRSITPDPAMARQWYQRAAELGSTDARRRLSQLQN
jgi:hypothetical protein